MKLKYLFEIASWVPGTPQTRNPLLPSHFWSNMDVTYLSAMVGQNSKSATLFVRKFGFVLKITLMQRADFLLIDFYQAVKSPPPIGHRALKHYFLHWMDLTKIRFKWGSIPFRDFGIILILLGVRTIVIDSF